ncbi:hypothetical protein MKEN_00100900 [Mycena kentingensis (nom. inval.)]|nr:hypothetical protein MKEN_00100900 [Mycena kentingensis (nom. inval.)]
MALRVAALLLLLLLHPTYAAPSPVPPFQWLHITSITGTTKPPGLKGAALGYDEQTRTLIVFGGEASNSGVPQGATYLLNLESLTWSTPSPPTNLQRTPPARSYAVSGVDSAASNRDAFIVIGGKGADNQPLSDAWAFDFVNHFWSPINISPGGPSARWGASGGIDSRVAAVSDPVLPGPNNTFFMFGGQNDGSSLTDLWRLNISGTLSSNLPDSIVGSWDQLSSPKLPGLTGQGGAVIGQEIVAIGGCNNTATPNLNCATQSTYLIHGPSTSGAQASNCPAPRIGPVVIPNGNKFSDSFSSQVLLLLGSFNSSMWDDGGGLEHGEVAVLDVMTQTWTRLLPAGDPGTSGKENFPTPRAGASAIMYPISLVGNTRSMSSDIIVFGGEDETGEFLDEVWVLRAYNGLASPSHPKWSGFGDGTLQSGINARGTGVTNTFVSNCAVAIAPPPPTSSADPTPPSNSDPTPPANFTVTFDASIVHKSFAPVSLALLLPSLLMYRHSSLFFNSVQPPLSRAMCYFSLVLAGVGYGLGVAAIATSFTSTTAPRHLGSTHGRAGLALFILLYGFVPLMAVLPYARRSRQSVATQNHDSRKSADSDVSEKERLPPSAHSPSPPASTTRRKQQSSWRRNIREDSMSVDSGETGDWQQTSSATAPRSFEVLNRPARTRRASTSQQAWTSPTPSSQSPADMEWMNRRRSLTIVGELDSTLNSSPTAPIPPPPSTPGTLLDPSVQTKMALLPFSAILVRVLSHIFLVAFCVFTLVALWLYAPKGLFAALLAWTALFYMCLFALAWSGKPDRSTLAILLQRLRAEPIAAPPRPSLSDTLPDTDENNGGLPYAHRPPYRKALPTDDAAAAAWPADTEDEDDDRAEEEMRRRDISMWTTYPKRALTVTNPSP